jgi:hypothetical protein
MNSQQYATCLLIFITPFIITKTKIVFLNNLTSVYIEGYGYQWDAYS